MIARPVSGARSSGSTERIRRQTLVTLMIHDLLEGFGLDMANGRNRAHICRHWPPEYQACPSVHGWFRRGGRGLHIRDIEWNQCGACCQASAYFVVQLFQAANRAGDGDHMRAAFCQFKRKEIANTARCARYQREAARKIDIHCVPVCVQKHETGGLKAACVVTGAISRCWRAATSVWTLLSPS